MLKILLSCIFPFLICSNVFAGNYFYHIKGEYYTYRNLYQNETIKYDPIIEKVKKPKIPKVKSDRPFRNSELYYEIQARKWMKELTLKAEKSLADKKEKEEFGRLKELRGLSGKYKLQLKDKRIVDGIMGKEFK